MNSVSVVLDSTTSVNDFDSEVFRIHSPFNVVHLIIWGAILQDLTWLSENRLLSVISLQSKRDNCTQSAISLGLGPYLSHKVKFSIEKITKLSIKATFSTFVVTNEIVTSIAAKVEKCH